MTDLSQKLTLMRYALKSDLDGVLAGKINEASTSSDMVPFWQPFFQLANGGNFGEIDLWRQDKLALNQFYCDDFPGGKEEWLVVGQVLYEPLAVSKTTGLVVLFDRFAAPRALGTATEFLNDFVFGLRYAELIPDVETSRWWQMLCQLGLVTKSKEIDK